MGSVSQWMNSPIGLSPSTIIMTALRLHCRGGEAVAAARLLVLDVYSPVLLHWRQLPALYTCLTGALVGTVWISSITETVVRCQQHDLLPGADRTSDRSAPVIFEQ